MLVARHRCDSVAEGDRFDRVQWFTKLGRLSGPRKFAWTVAGLAIAFSLMFPAAATQVSPWVFFLSLVVLGMPHGVIDAVILLSPNHSSAVFGGGNQGKCLAAYLGLCSAYAAVWYFQPALGMASFLLLTAWHWGSSEFGSMQSGRVLWVSLGATRGLVVVSALFAFHGMESNSVAGYHGLIVPEALGLWVFVSALVSHLIIFLFATRNGAHRRVKYLIEMGIVVALLAIAPVYMAVGIFYMSFHALRFYQWFPEQSRSNLATRGELKVLTHAICMVIAFLVLVICLLVGAQTDVASLAVDSVPVHLQVLAILTLPHTLLCYYFQRADNHWVSPRSSIDPGFQKPARREERG